VSSGNHDHVQPLGHIPDDALEQRLFELATDALVVCTVDGEIRRANAAAVRLATGAAARGLGGSLWDLVHPGDLAHVRALFAARPDADGRARYEEFRCRILRPGGESRWVEVRAVVDPGAGLCHLVARDISERDEADAERLSQAFRDAPIGMALIDPDGGFRRVNQALVDMLGRSEDELLATNALDVAADREAAARWEASREARDLIPSFQLEARLLSDAGEDVIALVSGTLVRDPAGHPLYYVCQFQDVTERIAAQEALAANEAKLAEAQQVARLGSWERLVDEDRVTWSDELYRIHGLRPEAVSHTWADHLERVHPDDRGRVARAVEQAVAEGRAWNIDHRIVRPDGDVRMVHVRGEVTLGPEGAVAVHGTCQDVTEARRVEDALRAAEQLFRRAFDDAPIGMALIDLEGRWLRLNRAIAQMAGRTEAELRTLTLRELSHPDDADLDRPLIRELLAGRRRSYAIEKRLLHADGRVMHMLAHVSLMHGDGERPLYFLVQLVDLSERRRAEAERRAGEQRLQAIIDNAPALIYVKDTQQRLVLVNRRWQETTGVGADDALGRTAAEAAPTEFAGGQDDDLDREVVGTGELRQMEVSVPDLRGEGERQYLLVKFPLLDTDGAISAVCSIATDLTDRRRAEQERRELELRLAQAQRLESVGQLAGGVAHDFNNLLSVILSCVTFAQDELEPSSPVREDVAEIGRAAERAAALTRQLLMFSRREVVRPEVLEVSPLLRDLESLLSRSLGERVSLRITCEEPLPPVLVDPSRFEQVLVNLAVNARDAMPAGGVLEIGVRPAGMGIEVTVEDEGTGMPPEVAGRAFEPFFTTKAPGEGTGLGLATVHGIVTDSGGEIAIDSRPGAGTVVRFTLPAAEAEPAPAEPEAAPPSAAGGARVLVVEDQDPVRRQAVRMLAKHGYEVREAASGEEALGAWEPVDLLVTDVVMPGMTGHDLAERAAELQPGLRVVFMSGHTEDVVVLDGAREGEIAFVQKPFTRDSLLGTVSRALEEPAAARDAAA
jgi:PAS domain S-box-containing protein